MTQIWMATDRAHYDMTEAELAEASRPRFTRPDFVPVSPARKNRGKFTVLFLAYCFGIPLAIYGAIHAGRAAMIWLLGVL